MKALNFEEPDRVPRHENFWPEFTEAWCRQKALRREEEGCLSVGMGNVPSGLVP